MFRSARKRSQGQGHHWLQNIRQMKEEVLEGEMEKLEGEEEKLKGERGKMEGEKENMEGEEENLEVEEVLEGEKEKMEGEEEQLEVEEVLEGEKEKMEGEEENHQHLLLQGPEHLGGDLLKECWHAFSLLGVNLGFPTRTTGLHRLGRTTTRN